MYCIHHHDCKVMNKQYCSCTSKLSLKSDVGVQTNFSDKQINNYKVIDPNILIDHFKKNYSGWCNGEQ